MVKIRDFQGWQYFHFYTEHVNSQMELSGVIETWYFIKIANQVPLPDEICREMGVIY